jgi:hypothetical protein
MIWWLDILSIVMLLMAGGCLFLMLADSVKMSELLPVQTLALVASMTAKGQFGLREKR